jgi:hypothetical protein
VTKEAKALIVIELSALLWLRGCVYRLMPPVLPTQQRLGILVNSPEQYSVRVQASDHRVGTDGRASFDSPMMSAGCSVYLLDRIPISRPVDLSKAKLISIMTGGTTVEMLSLRDLSKLRRTTRATVS